MNKQNIIIGLLAVATALLVFNLVSGGKETGYPTPKANPNAAKAPAPGQTPIQAAPGQTISNAAPGQPVAIKPTNTEQLPPEATVTDPAKMTTISFGATTHDFGVKKKPGKVSHVFKFKNTGDKPLIISNVGAGCGCTTPGWTKEPIAPGATGEVSAEVDLAKAGSGRVDKNLTVSGNFKEPIKLHMVGEIVE